MWFLPKYSPEWNPIEFLFGWVKSRLRPREARAEYEADPEGKLGRIFRSCPEQNLRGWVAGVGVLAARRPRL